MITSNTYADLIPHGRGMQLIDRVISFDKEKIHCETESHLNPNNPLLEDGKLHSVILVEYAAQAAAIHVALNHKETTKQTPAFIGSLKNISLSQHYLSGIAAPLTMMASCALLNNNGAIYEFKAFADTIIAQGRLSLISPTNHTG